MTPLGDVTTSPHVRLECDCGALWVDGDDVSGSCGIILLSLAASEARRRGERSARGAVR